MKSEEKYIGEQGWKYTKEPSSNLKDRYRELHNIYASEVSPFSSSYVLPHCSQFDKFVEEFAKEGMVAIRFFIEAFYDGDSQARNVLNSVAARLQVAVPTMQDFGINNHAEYVVQYRAFAEENNISFEEMYYKKNAMYYTHLLMKHFQSLEESYYHHQEAVLEKEEVVLQKEEAVLEKEEVVLQKEEALIYEAMSHVSDVPSNASLVEPEEFCMNPIAEQPEAPHFDNSSEYL